MNLKMDKKRLYALAVVILLIALLIAASIGERNAERIERIQPSPSDPVPTPDVSSAPLAEVRSESTMDTVVYYQDDNGYLVPVMRTIRQEDGVAKATIKMMVKSVYNDMEAARMGLRTVIPENTSFDLDISDGTAVIDLSREAMSCADREGENVMVSAIVHTLTEFPTVDRVKFRVEGKNVKTLTHGTDISGEFRKEMLNPENELLEPDDKTVTLYFTGDSPKMIVPVTRAVYGENDLQTAVIELVKGPSAQSPLNGVVPAGCGLIGAEIKNGTAKINFTKEFIRIAEETDGGRLALRALVLTAKEFAGVDKVEILVEGEVYDTGKGTLTVETFVNSASEIQDAFIMKQSELLFEFE